MRTGCYGEVFVDAKNQEHGFCSGLVSVDSVSFSGDAERLSVGLAGQEMRDCHRHCLMLR